MTAQIIRLADRRPPRAAPDPALVLAAACLMVAAWWAWAAMRIGESK